MGGREQDGHAYPTPQTSFLMLSVSRPGDVLLTGQLAREALWPNDFRAR